MTTIQKDLLKMSRELYVCGIPINIIEGITAPCLVELWYRMVYLVDAAELN